jgi:hypothetical protein
MSQQAVVEVAQFRVKPGVTVEQVVQASDALMVDLQAAPGYASRELMVDEHGQWVDMVHWRSMAEALAAAEVFPTWPSAQPFMELLDMSSAKMLHLETVREYET